MHVPNPTYPQKKNIFINFNIITYLIQAEAITNFEIDLCNNIFTGVIFKKKVIVIKK